MTRSRRDLLRAAGAAGVALTGGFAGCTTNPGEGTPTDGGMGGAPTETDGMGDSTETPTDDGSMEATTVQVRSHPDHGEILAGPDGMTLYVFAQDEPGTSNCTGGCAESWPPLTVEGSPTGPGDLPGELGTIERDDGSTQVTYMDLPLYYFVNDEEPGDVTGHGVNDIWFVATPEGGMGTGTPTESGSDGGGYPGY